MNLPICCKKINEKMFIFQNNLFLMKLKGWDGFPCRLLIIIFWHDKICTKS